MDGVFHRDVPPGHDQVTVETNGTDLSQKSDLDLAAGQQAYTKIVSNPEWVRGTLSGYERPTFYAWHIANDIAQATVANLDFYGGN